MAKKMMSKSSKRGDGEGGGALSGCYTRQPPPRDGHRPRQRNGSENDLHLNYNSVPRLYSSGQLQADARDVGYAPGGEVVELQKTRVVYHSRQDFSDVHSSV